MFSIRVLIDEPADGAWNMAVDEALLETAAERRQLTLRFYRWREPTLSLGYFQSHRERETHAASRHCPLVRRASGGGAIVHDRELTYSFVAPLEQLGGLPPPTWYGIFHSTLISVLAISKFKNPPVRWGNAQDRVTTSKSSEPEDGGLSQPRSDTPFLCFQRRAADDVVMEGVKIAGSAQRRRQGALLQHGSVLLGVAASPELPGWNDLTGEAISPEGLAERWLPVLVEAIGNHLEGVARGPASIELGDKLTPNEQELAAEIARSTYGSPRWNARK